jgi:hypothetical protein
MGSDLRHDIDTLIARVIEAAASPENQRRLRCAPSISVGIEEPIGWTKILGFDANRFYADPLLNFELQLRMKLWRWEHIPDDTPMTADTPMFLSYYPEYTFLGLAVSFSSEGIPRIQKDHPITRDPDLRHLRPLDFERSGWMPKILSWQGTFQELAAGRIATHFPEWGRACLDMAVQFRGYEALMIDIAERPGFVHGLLGFITEQRQRWFEGCDRYLGRKPVPAGIADDWLNVPYITPAFFEEFVLPRYLDIERYHGGLVSIHSCGNQAPLQKAMLRLGSLPFFEVSPWTDLASTLANVPADRKLGIGVHPNDVLVAPRREMEEKLGRIARLCAGRSYSVGTSGLTPLTGDLDAFLERIRTWLAAARGAFGA